MIFQLTHPWGCDSIICCCIAIVKFQLTHPWGCDTWQTITKQQCGSISTHTPVRVWQDTRPDWPWPFYFNSHTREGVTRGQWLHSNTNQQFQLTHPWGCDHQEKMYNTCNYPISTHTPVRVWLDVTEISMEFKDFNSHTREGVTEEDEEEDEDDDISTHTPVRVWHYTTIPFSEMGISTHTPVRVWRLPESLW